jgi:hypothetical protein
MSEPKEEINFYRLFRFSLILFFVILCVISIVQFGISVASLSSSHVSQFYRRSGIGLILVASGAIPLAISVLSLAFIVIGALSLKRMSTRQLVLYGLLLLFLCLLGFGIAIAGLAIINNTSNIKNQLINEFGPSFQKDVDPEISTYFQSNLKCCG